MAAGLDDLIGRIEALEEDLEDFFDKKRDELDYRVEHNCVIFEREVRARHRRLRIRLSDFLRRTRPMTVLTAPVIYAMIAPTLFLDLSVTVYQHVCFRAWGIARVRRAGYLVIDRHQLAYLNALEKLNCVYCGYANGVYAYAVEVAARTEQYWCPIKHARRVSGSHARYRHFADFGDAENYRSELKRMREALAAMRQS